MVKITRTTPDEPAFKIKQYPHCDQRILHAPGECQFCDGHPDWQALRKGWGIAYTGYDPEGTELPCPATAARGANINKWHGNVAQPLANSAPILCETNPDDQSSVTFRGGPYEDSKRYGPER